MSAGRARAIAGLGLVVLAAACGRKDNPLPPLRPEPGRIGDTRVRWIDDRVELHFTIPAANADGTTPSVIERVEIYALATPAGAPAPTAAQVVEASHLRGRVDIRHETAKQERARARSGAPPDTRPAPGDAATFVDRPAAVAPGAGKDASVLHYAVVGVTGNKRRSPPAGLLDVPMSAAPTAPEGLALTYDEQTLTLSWRAGASGRLFRVYDVDAAGEVLDPKGPVRPLQREATFSMPVVFDVPRCLTVRAVEETGPRVIEGAAAPAQCATPKDTFPPPVPSNLLAFSAEGTGTVELAWDAVVAPDLAGYVVLRGDGSGDKLLPLTKVSADLHFMDRNVTKGMTYTYAVRSEDVKGNASGLSNRQHVTVRIP